MFGRRRLGLALFLFGSVRLAGGYGRRERRKLTVYVAVERHCDRVNGQDLDGGAECSR